MLWKKIHGDPKIGDMSPKDNTIVNMRFVADVTATLIIWIALFISGGVSQVRGETLILEPEFMELTSPEFQELTEPEFMETTVLSNGTMVWTGKRITDPETAVLIEPEFMELTEPGFMEPTLLSNGMTIGMGSRDNLAYLRCAKHKGFTLRQKCARDALGMTQEKIDKAVGEYVKAAEEGNRQWK